MSTFRPTDLLAELKKKLRAIPFLTTGMALAGLVIFLILVTNNAHQWSTDSPTALNKSLLVSINEPARQQFLLETFFSHCRLAALCLLPAGIIALLTKRGLNLVPTIAVLAVLVGAAWLSEDMRMNWDAAHTTTLGETPSPLAYYAKLGIISLTVLSSVLLVWLYYRSTILDRYVARSFAVPFLLCMSGIVAIMITMDLLDHANDFVRGGFSLAMVVRYYLAQLPQLIVRIIDVVVLLAALYTLTRMSRFNEILSMLGSGRSLFRVLLPIFLIGCFCALIALALNYQWAPESERVKDNMLRYVDKSEERKRKEESTIYNVMYRNQDARRTWQIGQIPVGHEHQSTMTDLTVLQEDEQGKVERVLFARKAFWVAQLSEWRFVDVRIIDLKKSPDIGEIDIADPAAIDRARLDVLPPAFSRYNTREFTETPWNILSDRVKPEYLSVQELDSYLKSHHTDSQSKLAKYATTLHSRFSLPFRCILMALIAAPLGVIAGRRGGLGSAATAVFIFVLIFFLSTILLKIGEGSHLPPAAAAWIVNGAGFLIGLFLLWLRNNNRQFPSLNPFKRRRPAR